MATVVGEVFDRDFSRVSSGTLPSALDQAIGWSSDAELARLIERFRERAGDESARCRLTVLPAHWSGLLQFFGLASLE